MTSFPKGCAMQIADYLSIRDRMRSEFSGAAEDTSDAKGLVIVGSAIPTTEDTVSFSEKALALARIHNTEESAALDKAENETKDTRSKKQGMLSGNAGMSGDNSAQQNLEALQKQIEAAQKQLDRANQELQKVQAEARSTPLVLSEKDSGEVKEARNVVSEASSRLLQLQDQMNRAMRDAYGIGPGGGGQIGGTRAGSTGVGTISGNIGKGTDPYAAAQAAEAAQLSDSGEA